MDLFYTYKPQIQSANLESQSEMLLEIGKKIAAKKLKKIEKALKTKEIEVGDLSNFGFEKQIDNENDPFNNK